ncbi:THxN family PEP-CTERM protein [Pelagibius sp. Alg239-R121]|uniref:THxN family PEP-CTERM protein n=1 Tax=Pelagibius sp. Alg239-R121 TaxID=2993448 RepID=UPI0024A69906|nr:THxN family PEP-CTERM protein [Pelagibius sp. Alg239-R121]
MTLCGVVLVALYASSNEVAAAPVTEWDYAVSAGFSNFSPEAPDQNSDPNRDTNRGVVGDNVAFGSPTRLRWGTPLTPASEPGSALSVTSYTGGDGQRVATNGEAVEGFTLTHDNRLLQGPFGNLESFQLTVGLEFRPDGGLVEYMPITLDFSYREQRTDDCLIDDPLCIDVLVLENPEELVQSFVLDGELYSVEVLLADFGPLSDDACGLAGAAFGCFGVATHETGNEVREYQSSVRISSDATGPTVAVPEPGTLALFGSSLMFLGLARRRKVLKR